MALPRAVGRFNKVVTNKVLVHLVGHGPFVELEHVGRRSGRVYRVTLMAFRSGDRVTFALTYGPDTDWLRNVRAAAGCRLRIRGEILTLGAPVDLSGEAGRLADAGPGASRAAAERRRPVRRAAGAARRSGPGDGADRSSRRRPRKAERSHGQAMGLLGVWG